MRPVQLQINVALANAIRRMCRSVGATPERMQEAKVTAEQLEAIKAAIPHQGPAVVPYERGSQSDETLTCDVDVAGSQMSAYTTGFPHVSAGKLWLFTVDQDGREVRMSDGAKGVIHFPAGSPQPISHITQVSWSTPPTKTAYGPGEVTLVGRA